MAKQAKVDKKKDAIAPREAEQGGLCPTPRSDMDQALSGQDEKKETAPAEAATIPEGAAAANPESAEQKALPDSSPDEPSRLRTEDDLLSLEELEMEFRVASWMQAALCRRQGWEKGKRVTRGEYEAALDALGHRRLGGGRR